MKGGAWYLAVLAISIGLAGAVDYLSRARDAALEERVTEQVNAPSSWLMTVADTTYLCLRDRHTTDLSYRCERKAP